MMGFEFDPQKSDRNLANHGIDFVEAQQLWNDSNLLEIPARTEDEPRFIVIGQINAKHWSAVITYRGDDIRIISVRRSREEEVIWYES
ncbi:MAG: BrnT family toxin [Proteobacteria bacterium]|nr:BrnT family toxin [Pseudomonadota bacterium]MCH8265753.1 BrnT family toxin [Pseudomonadota bacterium]